MTVFQDPDNIGTQPGWKLYSPRATPYNFEDPKTLNPPTLNPKPKVRTQHTKPRKPQTLHPETLTIALLEAF